MYRRALLPEAIVDGSVWQVLCVRHVARAGWLAPAGPSEVAPDRPVVDLILVTHAGCFRHQLLLSRPYLRLTKALTPSFRNERSCERKDRM